MATASGQTIAPIADSRTIRAGEDDRVSLMTDGTRAAVAPTRTSQMVSTRTYRRAQTRKRGPFGSSGSLWLPGRCAGRLVGGAGRLVGGAGRLVGGAGRLGGCRVRLGG